MSERIIQVRYRVITEFALRFEMPFKISNQSKITSNILNLNSDRILLAHVTKSSQKHTKKIQIIF